MAHSEKNKPQNAGRKAKLKMPTDQPCITPLCAKADRPISRRSRATQPNVGSKRRTHPQMYRLAGPTQKDSGCPGKRKPSLPGPCQRQQHHHTVRTETEAEHPALRRLQNRKRPRRTRLHVPLAAGERSLAGGLHKPAQRPISTTPGE